MISRTFDSVLFWAFLLELCAAEGFTYTFITPALVSTCEPVNVSWNAGYAPYTLVAYFMNNGTIAAEVSFGDSNVNTMVFEMLGYSDSVTFHICDAFSNTANSNTIPMVLGSTACGLTYFNSSTGSVSEKGETTASSAHSSYSSSSSSPAMSSSTAASQSSPSVDPSSVNLNEVGTSTTFSTTNGIYLPNPSPSAGPGNGSLNTSSPSAALAHSPPRAMSVPAVVGGSLGGLVVGLIVSGLAFLLFQRWRKRRLRYSASLIDIPSPWAPYPVPASPWIVPPTKPLVTRTKSGHEKGASSWESIPAETLSPATPTASPSSYVHRYQRNPPPALNSFAVDREVPWVPRTPAGLPWVPRTPAELAWAPLTPAPPYCLVDTSSPQSP